MFVVCSPVPEAATRTCTDVCSRCVSVDRVTKHSVTLPTPSLHRPVEPQIRKEQLSVALHNLFDELVVLKSAKCSNLGAVVLLPMRGASSGFRDPIYMFAASAFPLSTPQCAADCCSSATQQGRVWLWCSWSSKYRMGI